MSAGEKFYFKPTAGEHIETTVSLTPDTSAAILGTVFSAKDVRVSNALVLLFRAGEEKKLIDRQFTDDEGHFFFGPIEGDVMYQIKIYKNHVKIRELEIVTE
ncbi:MAG: hypothetical protein FWC90_00890 [Oscillospiraceae bacterium]|nr:hypothetical protein [Oscillospiraceae bacterium]